jgi:hypothetical protein
MCRFAGEALQFYKTLGGRIQLSSNKRPRGHRAARSAAARRMKPGVRRSIAATSCAVKTAVHGGGRAPIGSTVVSKAEVYLNSDRMLWLFWLAIESA